MRRRPRKLTSEERRLWQSYARDLDPARLLPGEEEAAPAAPEEPEAPPPAPPTGRLPLYELVRRPRPEPPVRLDLAPDPMALPELSGPPRMDARAYTRMTRGRLEPEARIDLHGMSADSAHDALRRFVLGAHARGLRLVLVITGKGRDRPDEPWTSPARRGVLRNAVPHWLAQPPLALMVLQIAPAHLRHGGGGAYYVYLRRPR